MPLPHTLGQAADDPGCPVQTLVGQHQDCCVQCVLGDIPDSLGGFLPLLDRGLAGCRGGSAEALQAKRTTLRPVVQETQTEAQVQEAQQAQPVEALPVPPAVQPGHPPAQGQLGPFDAECRALPQTFQHTSGPRVLPHPVLLAKLPGNPRCHELPQGACDTSTGTVLFC
eukprot:3621891-Lingulodinium_polyedra.AAC.1